MAKRTRFECPRCHEPFQYSPAALVEKRITETELQIGRACIIMIECPHCPESLTINRETGRTEKFSKVSSNSADMGGIVWDMSFTEKGKEEVTKLVEEGDRISRSDPRRAAEIFQKAIAIRKHDPHAWYNLGVCQHRLGDRLAAEASYRHVLEYDPTIIQAWNNLGTCLVEQQRLDEGDECFDRGIAVNPDNPKFYLGKGNIAAMRGDYETARNYLQMALKKDPNYQPARDGLERINSIAHVNKGSWIKRIFGR